MLKRAESGGRRPGWIVAGVGDRGKSDQAVLAALDLGRRLSAQVELVHAVPALPLIWPGTDPAQSEARSEELTSAVSSAADAHVRKLVASSRSLRLPRATASGSADLVRILPGHPARVLLDRARARRARMLVLGAHEKRGRLEFGNTVHAVLARAEVPVWVQLGPYRPVRRILVPVDLSRESLASLARACDLARVLLAGVRVVSCFHAAAILGASGFDDVGYVSAEEIGAVRSAEREEFESATRKFDWRGVRHRTEFLDGDPAATILRLASSADLIVMGTHGRTGLAAALLGSVARSVLSKSKKPVLVLRYGQRSFLT